MESKLPLKRRSTLTISMQELSGLESELDLIRKYVKRTNTGRVRIRECPGGIKLSVVDSKEMST